MPSFLRAHVFAVMLGALALGAAAPAVQAQKPPPAPVIIIVDMNQIMREAKAAKDVQAQLEKEQAAYTKEIAQKEGELKSMQDELDRQRMAMAPEVLNEKSREFQQRYAILDREVQTKRQAMQQILNDAIAKIEGAALQIVADIAKERNANMVVNRAALFYLADGLDITAEVTRRLDQKLPALALNIPKDQQGMAPSTPGATKPGTPPLKN